MKIVASLSSLLFILLFACKDSGKEPEAKSENDMDAARNFLEAALRGDYKSASSYMLQDSANLGYLAVTERSYQRLNQAKRDSLKNASLRFYDTHQVNDSTTITVFANSYRNEKDTLRIIRTGGQWLVDLKYLFEHDMDSSLTKPNNKIDTIQK